MLEPKDYNQDAIHNKTTRALMEKMSFEHGGKEYDSKYPEGIPTSVQITMANGKTYDSKLVMFPTGHAKNTTANLEAILKHKFHLLGRLALSKSELDKLLKNLGHLENLKNADLQKIYDVTIKYDAKSIDAWLN